jgi:ABC-type antimicrobial peptide transport system permease subunit
MEPVRRAVAQLDPREAIYNARTLEDVVSSALAARRISMLLLTGFGALACIGLYSVISYLVGQRTREIGVRMAMGANRGNIFALVLGHGVRMALVGSAAGMAAALGLTRLMAAQIFGVSPHDPATFAAATVLLTLVALAAGYIPARRAVRVDPSLALRA